MLSRPFILEMSYKLCKWNSNSPLVLQKVPKELRDSDEVLPKTIAMPRP